MLALGAAEAQALCAGYNSALTAVQIMNPQNIDIGTFQELVRREVRYLTIDSAVERFRPNAGDLRREIGISPSEEFQTFDELFRGDHYQETGLEWGEAYYKPSPIPAWWHIWVNNTIEKFEKEGWPVSAIGEVRRWKEGEIREWRLWRADMLSNRKFLLKERVEWKEWEQQRTAEWERWVKDRKKQWADNNLHEYRQVLKELEEIEPDNPVWRDHGRQLQVQGIPSGSALQLSQRALSVVREKRKEVSNRKAEEVLHRNEVLARLCPALRSDSNDVFGIATILTPVLITAALGKQLQYRVCQLFLLQPLWSWCAWEYPSCVAIIRRQRRKERNESHVEWGHAHNKALQLTAR